MAGCSDGPDRRDLSEGEAAACRDLVAALPDRLGGAPMTDSDDRTASWGDIELTCGVDRPEEYDEYAPCIEIRKVGWFVPDDQLKDLGGDATATALTHTPYVALLVPADQRSGQVDQMLTELAGPVRSALEPTEPCR